jgi:hypothetical protein
VASRNIETIVADMEVGREISFGDLARVCDHYFGTPRQRGTSHRVYRMPWSGDPRVNIQNDGGRAKPYQVRQVLKAIVRLKEERERKMAATIVIKRETSERRKRG